MNPSNRPIGQKLRELMNVVQPTTFFIILIFGALIAFEIFNYSTTDHALQDLLGTLEFGGMKWSTILALAFCGIDFAGIARLFTPEQSSDEPKEVWYLFGAWILAATMNAILTWWGVSMAITNHQVRSASVVDPKTIATVVPVFVAVMVWVIRILIIGTLSLALDRTIHGAARRPSGLRRMPTLQPITPPASLNAANNLGQRPSLARVAASQAEQRSNRPPAPSYNARAETSSEPVRAYPEPTYHSLSMNARPNNSNARVSEGNGSGSPRKF